MDTDWRGVQLVVGGEAEETADSMQSLIFAFVRAVIAIFLLLMLLFGSMLQPFDCYVGHSARLCWCCDGVRIAR